MTTWLPRPKIALTAGTAWRVRRCALGVVSIACLSTSASSVVATRDARYGRGRADDAAAPCALPAALRLCLVNRAAEPEESLVAARLETDAIWAGADLKLRWCERGSAVDPAAGPTVTIILRDLLPTDRVHAQRSGRPFGDALAWTLFDGAQPTNIIEVSFTAVAGLVMRESFAGRPVTALTQDWRRRLIGRALGRVIAHEIGHWLWGASHARDGLMGAGLSGSALIDQRAPALPRGSIGEAAMQRLTGATGCVTPVSPG